MKIRTAFYIAKFYDYDKNIHSGWEYFYQKAPKLFVRNWIIKLICCILVNLVTLFLTIGLPLITGNKGYVAFAILFIICLWISTDVCSLEINSSDQEKYCPELVKKAQELEDKAYRLKKEYDESHPFEAKIRDAGLQKPEEVARLIYYMKENNLL